MGEIANYYIDKMLDDRHYPRYPTKKRVTWTTSSGEVLEPHEMDNDHLMNVAHLCERREGHKGIEFLNNAPTYKAIVQELIEREKLAAGYFDLTIGDRLRVRI